MVSFLRKGDADGLFIDLAHLSEGDGFETDLIVFERAVPLPPNDAAQGIVRRTCDAEDSIVGHEQAEEGDGEGVRARKEHGRGEPKRATVRACVPERSTGEAMARSAPKARAKTRPRASLPSSP